MSMPYLSIQHWPNKSNFWAAKTDLVKFKTIPWKVFQYTVNVRWPKVTSFFFFCRGPPCPRSKKWKIKTKKIWPAWLPCSDMTWRQAARCEMWPPASLSNCLMEVGIQPVRGGGFGAPIWWRGTKDKEDALCGLSAFNKKQVLSPKT